jgi:hypothetical protein
MGGPSLVGFFRKRGANPMWLRGLRRPLEVVSKVDVSVETLNPDREPDES